MYPRTSEERLIKLYGFTIHDLNKIYKDCGEDKIKYKAKVEEIDKQLAHNVYKQITGDEFIVH